LSQPAALALQADKFTSLYVSPKGGAKPAGEKWYVSERFASLAAPLMVFVVWELAARLHLIDKLFHSVAQQLPWDALTRAFLRRLFFAQGLQLPVAPEEITLEATVPAKTAYVLLIHSDRKKADVKVKVTGR